MWRLLLTVEGTFLNRGRDILELFPWLVDLTTSRPLQQSIDDLYPEFPRVPSPRPGWVELRLPDGQTRTVACRFADAHVNWGVHRSETPPGSKPPWVVVCGLLAVSPTDVPVGAQVWYDTDNS